LSFIIGFKLQAQLAIAYYLLKTENSV